MMRGIRVWVKEGTGLLKEIELILNDLGFFIQLRGTSEKFINDRGINKLV